jgi:hypothetical protein
MAAGVLATLPVAAGVPGTSTLPVVVFASVFTTILVFAIGFPMLRTRQPARVVFSLPEIERMRDGTPKPPPPEPLAPAGPEVTDEPDKPRNEPGPSDPQ